MLPGPWLIPFFALLVPLCFVAIALHVRRRARLLAFATLDQPPITLPSPA